MASLAAAGAGGPPPHHSHMLPSVPKMKTVPEWLRRSNGINTRNNSNRQAFSSTVYSGWMYRVSHLVADSLLLTLKYELDFSIRSLYCGGTFNLMSTNSVPQPDGPPCNVHSFVKQKLTLQVGCPQKHPVCYLVVGEVQSKLSLQGFREQQRVHQWRERDPGRRSPNKVRQWTLKKATHSN